MAVWRAIPPSFPRRLAVGLALVLLLGAAACTGDEPSPVRVAAVGRADVAELVEAPAQVVARASATVRSPAEGTITLLRVGDGDRVRKGEVLARIDSPATRQQLADARAADAELAGGVAVPAGVDFSAFQARSERAAAQGFERAVRAARRIPEPELRARVLTEIARAKAQYALARSAARSAIDQLNRGLVGVSSAMSSITAAQRVQTRAAVRAAERGVAALTLRAPFAGVVSLGGPPATGGDVSELLGRLSPGLAGAAGGGTGGGGAGSAAGQAGGQQPAMVGIGVPVSPGGAVATVTDVSELSLAAEVDETDVLLIRRGIGGEAEFDALPGARYPVRVTGVGVTPAQTGTGGVGYRVTLRLGEGTTADGRPAPAPLPGMSAVVDLEVRQASDTVAVPSSALVTSGRDSVVWVVEGDRARRRVVRLGAQGDEVVQILGGLAPGERVVIRGADEVRPGQRIPPP